MLPITETKAAGRPRSAEVDRAIVDATLDLMVQDGYNALSMEQVAARAGVGKATVYRRWPNKLALVADAGNLIVEPEAAGDEPAMMARRFTGPVVVARRRIDALAVLAREHPVELDPSGRVSIAGVDVTTSIRTARIDKMVPVVARHARVREVMRERQRRLAERSDSVMEGRDIGTVVAPAADVKVYLVADAEVRAARRRAERPEVGDAALDVDPDVVDES